METPDEKVAQIRALELKMATLLEERQEIQKKCDSEPDPKKRALYWTKLAAIDNAIHNFKNDIFKRKSD